MSLIIREATREDIEGFSPMQNKPSIIAVAGELNGAVVLLAGIAFSNGRWFAFCDLRDEARPYKMTIAREAKRFYERVRKMGIRFIYAEADPDEPNAVRWITSLGFKLDPRTLYLYRWES